MIKYLLWFVLSLFLCVGYSQGSKIRISTSVGPGYSTGKLQSDLPQGVEKHLRKLKSGTIHEIDLGYDISEVWGVGIYSRNFLSSETSTVDGGFFQSDFSGRSISATNTIRMIYVAPKLYFMPLDEDLKYSLVPSVSVGYLSFRNDILYEGVQTRLSNNALGIGMGVGFEYKLLSEVSLVANFNAVIGFISEYKVKSADGERKDTVEKYTNNSKERENLSNIGLTIGVRVIMEVPKLDLRRKK